MTHPHPHPYPQSVPAPSAPRRPASGRPLYELFQSNQRCLSADGRYLAVPATVLEQMPLGWQQQMAELLRHLQRDHAAAPWPFYTVTPKAAAAVSELSEDQLAEVGIVFEFDDAGEESYRWRAGGDAVASPETTQVLVTVRDRMFPTQ